VAQLVRLGAHAARRIERRLGAAIELGEVRAQAQPRVRMGRVHGVISTMAAREQPLDLAHRGDEPVPLGRGERVEERPRESRRCARRGPPARRARPA
jgi:hypothetical protein